MIIKFNYLDIQSVSIKGMLCYTFKLNFFMNLIHVYLKNLRFCYSNFADYELDLCIIIKKMAC